MKSNTIKAVGLIVGAMVTLASSGAAFAGNSPFCFGGSPTPKYICDLIKANQKPRPVVANPNLTNHGSGGRVFAR
jgi:hypothetical protein